MIRISSGHFRGRKLRVPRAGVRPTKDMVRQALFSALGDSIVGKRMADLFAGSGAVGIEALSRGAAEVFWVESDPRTFTLLKENVEAIEPGAVPRCSRSDAFTWLQSKAAPVALDFVFADPPYRSEDGQPWGLRLLDAVARSVSLKPEGLFVLEQHEDEPVVDNASFDVIKTARYGETLLVYYRKKTS